MFRLLLLLKIAKFQGKQKISKFRVRFLHGGKKKNIFDPIECVFSLPVFVGKAVSSFYTAQLKNWKDTTKTKFFFSKTSGNPVVCRRVRFCFDFLIVFRVSVCVSACLTHPSSRDSTSKENRKPSAIQLR